PRATPKMRPGKVRGIAVTTEKKASAFPDLPTMSQFYPGFTADNWYGMFVRSGTPQPIIAKINTEILKALKTPTVIKFMADEGLDPVGSTPAELAALLRREIAKCGKTMGGAGIKL